MERAEVNDDLLHDEVLPRLRAILGLVHAVDGHHVSWSDAKVGIDTLLQKVIELVEEDATP